LAQAEQGFGDVIQFCRYIPMLENLGAKVLIQAPPSLLSLLATLPGNHTLIANGETVPTTDFRCPLMSLPLAFKTTLETIPSGVPYLSSDPAKRSAWRQKLGEKTKPRIGIAWSGRMSHINDRNRSLPLRDLEPLLQLPFEFHSLQKECRRDDGLFLSSLPQVKNHQEELIDFSDTAALISEMDLVLSVDTSVAHLAGALGKPLWLLLPFLPDFRWLLNRPDSPWYPTAVLFRQTSQGDWGKVVGKVLDRLKSEFKI
jgi:hypothetical protein